LNSARAGGELSQRTSIKDETMELQDEAIYLLRATVAAILGGLVGWDREVHERPAGVRTHMLVALSAALFTCLAHIVMSDFSAEISDQNSRESDPLRVLEAVVTGVSFLGAGTVFSSRGKGVQGLTTAASLWAVSVVGVACGVGHYVIAGGTTVLVMLILVAVTRLLPNRPRDSQASDS
jgi:putative Mg2+ transporter-C (MgtC) family protein